MKHPHFDDRGTLDWHTDYAKALAAARAANKIVFIEFGREACGQCRALVQSVVPHPPIAALLREHFVALASDCDEAETEVEQLAARLEDAQMLPFVLFADAQGKFLEGSSGPVNPARFEAVLRRLSEARG